MGAALTLLVVLTAVATTTFQQDTAAGTADIARVRTERDEVFIAITLPALDEPES